MTNPSNRQRGFSLIELLLVVAIIGIIAAISITYIVQARQATRSASAVASLRTLHSAEVSYKTVSGAYASLADLGTSEFLKDPSLIDGKKSGYNFDVTLDDPAIGDSNLYYSATATPTEHPDLALHFFIDSTGTIRSKLGDTSTRTDAPLQ